MLLELTKEQMISIADKIVQFGKLGVIDASGLRALYIKEAHSQFTEILKVLVDGGIIKKIAPATYVLARKPEEVKK